MILFIVLSMMKIQKLYFIIKSSFFFGKNHYKKTVTKYIHGHEKHSNISVPPTLLPFIVHTINMYRKEGDTLTTYFNSRKTEHSPCYKKGVAVNGNSN